MARRRRRCAWCGQESLDDVCPYCGNDLILNWGRHEPVGENNGKQ